MTPDRWFVRELRCIDSTYYVEWNEDIKLWEVKKDRETLEGNKKFFERDPVLDVFEHLNARALTHLRYRKWLGRKFEGDKDKHIRWLHAGDKEAKQKKIQRGLELMVEGYVRIHSLGKRQYFS